MRSTWCATSPASGSRTGSWPSSTPTNVRAADRKGWIELARRMARPAGRNRARPRHRHLHRAEPGTAGSRLRGASGAADGVGAAPRRTAASSGGLSPSLAATVRAEADRGGDASTRQPLWTDKRGDAGPFDIIGDIHGCAGELQLCSTGSADQIAWRDDRGERAVTVTPPAGRKAVFVGDLVDRGPNIPDVLRIAISMTAAGSAYVVQGNHERKLERWLAGRKVTVAHGLQQTIDQLGGQDRGLRDALPAFLDGLRSHLWLDNGRLAVAHAGLKETMIGRGSPRCARVRALRRNYRRDRRLRPAGPRRLGRRATGVRRPWSMATLRWPRADWVNNTICIDTGCVFGGKLTALRWPEQELVDRSGRSDLRASRCVRSAPANDAVAAQADADRSSRYPRR